MTTPDPAAVLELMRNRRVRRDFTAEPVAEATLAALVDAACWAPSSGNQRTNRYLVIRDAELIGRIRHVAPGMLGHPAALIVILTDARRAAEYGARLERDPRGYRPTQPDAGAAAQSVLLAAQAHGLAACPLTSFSVAGVAALLGLPEHLAPDYVVQLGHPAKPLEWRGQRRRPELVDWDAVAPTAPTGD